MSTEKLKSFIELGNQINDALTRKESDYEGLSKQQINLLVQIKKAGIENGWFSKEMVDRAFQGIVRMLNEDQLEKWIEPYIKEMNSVNEIKEVGIIMAGNIPAVGFHDLLCVLVSGHKAVVKTSSEDSLLIPGIVDLLISIDNSFSDKVIILKAPRSKYDAVIATGSNNSARYFE